MKTYTVTIKISVMARDDQCAWEYGHALATQSANRFAGCQDTEEEALITVEEEGA